VIARIEFAAEEAYTMYGRRNLERTARHVRDGKKIFLLKTGTYRTAAGDLTRNPPVLSSANSLYFRCCDEPDRDALLKRFPGRDILVSYPDTRLTNRHPCDSLFMGVSRVSATHRECWLAMASSIVPSSVRVPCSRLRSDRPRLNAGVTGWSMGNAITEAFFRARRSSYLGICVRL
jgi:hypothetical protein